MNDVAPTAAPRESTRAQGPLHIPSLDGLRALSFLMVFAAHGGLPIGLPFPGGFGVTVFFFLSGFLITTLMRVERAKTGTVSLGKFYLRRVLRILPPFYLILLAAVLAHQFGLLPGKVDPSGVRAQALHYANYWIIENTFVGLPLGTGVYWSLAVEEHFYLLFPTVFLALARTGAAGRTQSLVLLGLCALVLGWRAFLNSAETPPFLHAELATDTRFDSLLFGCALAMYENPALDRSGLRERTWKFVLLPLGLIGLAASFLIRDQSFRDVWRYSLQGLALVPVFVCAVRYPGWLPMRLLNVRPLAKLGALSYSLYLMHQVVLEIVVRNVSVLTDPLARGLFALGVSIALSLVIYRFIEQPCARLRRTLSA